MIMNIKRIFGALLTTLEIVSILYAAVISVNNVSGGRDIKSYLAYRILGLIFFLSGITLVKATKDES